jgi:hypothetical protein
VKIRKLEKKERKGKERGDGWKGMEGDGMRWDEMFAENMSEVKELCIVLYFTVHVHTQCNLAYITISYSRNKYEVWSKIRFKK